MVERGLSTRQTEDLVRRQQAGAAAGRQRKKKSAASDPDVQRLEQTLSERLGAVVQLRQGAKGSGQLVIRYSSLDQLDGILSRFDVEQG